MSIFVRQSDAAPRGLYIHGAVGRGKTMLMDLFFDNVDFTPKTRCHFHEFMADDIAMVERIYDLADHPMTPAARAQLDAYLEQNRRGKHGRLVYDLRADFGIDPDALRKRFDFYFERFPIRAEGH